MRTSGRVIVASLLAALAWSSAATAGPGRKPAAGPRAPKPAAAPTARDVVARVQARYRGIDHAHARFTQEVTNAAFGSTKASKGSVWLERPGKMRWTYDGKPHRGKVEPAKDFISDGTTFYLLDHENQQVVEKKLEDAALPAAVAFLQGTGNLAAQYTVAFETGQGYAPAGSVVVRLVPKAPSAQLKHLHLVVDPADFHVAETIVTDGADNTNRFRFGALDTPADIPDSTFEVDPQRGALRAYRLIKP